MRIVRDIEVEVSGRDVLIIDDVLDSGLTLKFARDLMMTRGARRAAIAVMVNKPEGRRAERPPTLFSPRDCRACDGTGA